jgi:hypothetical protein
VSVGAIVTGLGRAIVSWGFGGGAGDSSSAGPGYLRIPRAAPLCTIVIPRVTLMPSNRLHIGDVAAIGRVASDAFPTASPILTYDSAGALADPDSLVVRVQTELGVTFSLTYGVTPGVEGGDAVIRYGVGMYGVRIRITEERGTGVYGITIVTDGNEAAEPTTFTVATLPA